MKKLISFYLIIILALIGFDQHIKFQRSSDAYVRDRVVQLKGNDYACTGIQVKAPSGKVYTLTAKHCQELLNDQKMVESIDEHGKKSMIKLVAISRTTDLMLLTAASDKYIDVADKTYVHQKIHTLTHGAVQPTYRTDGELLKDEIARAMLYIITSDEDLMRCKAGFNVIAVVPFTGLVCGMELNLRFSTAWVVGGSSGGPGLNEAGQLIGIVSVGQTGTQFSGLVRIEDINSFLKAR